MSMETRERWCFTKRELQDPKHCCRQDAHYAEADRTSEARVILTRDGKATNKWEDGVVGVPEEIQELAESDESPEGADGELADIWRDVICTSDGQFLRFAARCSAAKPHDMCAHSRTCREHAANPEVPSCKGRRKKGRRTP